MNKIIFVVTAFVSLALVASGRSSVKVYRGPSGATFIKAEAPWRMPERNIPAQRERPVAVEVTDEALEYIRRSSKFAYVLLRLEQKNKSTL